MPCGIVQIALSYEVGIVDAVFDGLNIARGELGYSYGVFSEVERGEVVYENILDCTAFRREGIERYGASRWPLRCQFTFAYIGV